MARDRHWVMFLQPRNAGSTRSRQRPGASSLRGNNPARPWVLNFWPPELGEKRFLFLKPPSLGCFVTAAPGH